MREQQRARSLLKERQDYNHLGDFIFDDNEEFRQKTQTCYIVKPGFSYQTVIDLEMHSDLKKKQSKEH